MDQNQEVTESTADVKDEYAVKNDRAELLITLRDPERSKIFELQLKTNELLEIDGELLVMCQDVITNTVTRFLENRRKAQSIK